jgi:hypothetical protein
MSFADPMKNEADTLSLKFIGFKKALLHRIKRIAPPADQFSIRLKRGKIAEG